MAVLTRGSTRWAKPTVRMLGAIVVLALGCTGCTQGGNRPVSPRVPRAFRWAATSAKLSLPFKFPNVYAGPGDTVYLVGSGDLVYDRRSSMFVPKVSAYIYKVDGRTLKVVKQTALPPGPAFVEKVYSDDQSNTLYLTAYNRTLSIFDGKTLVLRRNAITDRGPHGIAKVEGGLICVACYESNVIDIIDPNTCRVVAVIPVGTAPYSLASDGGRWLYVGYNSEAYISKIDVRLRKEVRRYGTKGPASVGSMGFDLSIGASYILLTPTADYLFACGRGAGDVCRVDLNTGRVQGLVLDSGCYSLAYGAGLVFPGTELSDASGNCFSDVIDPSGPAVVGQFNWSPVRVGWIGDVSLAASLDGRWLYTLTSYPYTTQAGWMKGDWVITRYDLTAGKRP